jgi:hypothetical protein
MHPPSVRPELWGGVEYTVNRVGDAYHDQLARSRHLTRVNDLDRFAQLGMRALRVPVLWEHAQQARGAKPDFSSVTPMLQRTRELGLRAVAGLCHHGSGPRFTNLLDPEFGPALAEYASEVARAFPWIEDYTPINEPVTTARFSALYGHWFPHLAVSALTHEALDICDRAQLRAHLRALRPWAVINAAGFARVAVAEQDAPRYFRDNVDGPALLAEECGRAGLRLLTFTSDRVFDGKRRRPYLEIDPVSPVDLYGISQAHAERRILSRPRSDGLEAADPMDSSCVQSIRYAVLASQQGTLLPSLECAIQECARQYVDLVA